MAYAEGRRERFSNEKQRFRSSVLVGNWNEDVFFEEEKIADLLEKKSEGKLSIQKTNRLLEATFQPVELTRNHDGVLHDGDTVMLKWVGGPHPRYLAATPVLPVASDPDDGRFKAPCPVSGTEDSRVCGRSAFVIYREDDRIPDTIPLMYGEPFFICTIGHVGNLKLYTDYKTVFKYARKSKYQEVEFVKDPSGRTLWRVFFKNPNFRMEMEGQYIPVNTDLIINHIYTNQHLALEPNHVMRTIFGVENEISGSSRTDQYRVEEPPNYWQFTAPLADPSKYDTNIKLPGQERINPNNYEVVIAEDDRGQDGETSDLKDCLPNDHPSGQPQQLILKDTIETDAERNLTELQR